MTDIVTIAVVILAGFLVGLAKGGLGSIVGALVTLLLSLVMPGEDPVQSAVSVGLVIIVVGDVVALPIFWREWDAKLVKLMLPAALVGSLLGALSLAYLPGEMLGKLIGVFVLAVVVYKALGERYITGLTYQPRDWHGVLAGWLSGFGSALANTGGPQVTAYLMLLNTPPRVYVATTLLFFTVIDLLKVPLFLLAGVFDAETLPLALWGVLALPLGLGAGKYFVDRVNPRLYEAVILTLIFISSVMLLLS